MNKLRTLLLLLSVSALTSAVAEDLVLKPEQLTARYKAKVEQKNGAITINSHTAEWDSGLLIEPPKGKKFDFSKARYLAVDVENLSKDRQLRMTMHISSGVRNGKSSRYTHSICTLPVFFSTSRLPDCGSGDRCIQAR